MRSLRRQMILGSLLWMVGLFVVMHLVGSHLVERFPDSNSRWIVHYSAIAFTAAGFIAVGLAQVQKSLKPFDRLRDRLAALRDGRHRRVGGTYPQEVQPLVDDLNALLDDRERAITRALATAGDLAHGLKTPLAILSQEADRAEAAGEIEFAEAVRSLVERMRRQVDYHLAHARATASAGTAPGVRCPVSESAQALARTMLRLHSGRRLDVRVETRADHEVRASREDLDEMLGNLMDNACKWARILVRVSSEARGGRIVVFVDDDGPGLDPSMVQEVLRRGFRADQAAPGSGLGLAIVRDLAELYGGSVALGSSPEGGVRAELSLPAA